MAGLSVHMLVRKVDLLTLRLFLAAIEERQIGRAASLENIAASAATKRIQDLEEAVGLKLLERNPKGVEASASGKVLARRLRAIFAELEDARRELSEFSEGVRGYVRVAATGAIIIQHLAREVGVFTRDFPFIDIELQEDHNPGTVKALKSGDVDFAIFVRTPFLPCDDIDSISYRTDELVVVYPRDHAFSERTSVTVADLLRERLIGIQPATTLMRTLSEAARALGHELKPKYSVNGVEAARSMVEAGLGVTIQPECMLSIEDFARVATIPIAEPWALRHFDIGTLHGKTISPAARLLIEQLTSRPANTNDGAVDHGTPEQAPRRLTLESPRPSTPSPVHD